MAVHQHPSRVARVDGCVSLNKIFQICKADVGPAYGAHNSHRDGLVQAEGIADGKHNVACFEFPRLSEAQGRKVFRIDLDHGKVRPWVRAYDPAFELPFVVEDDLDLL